MVIALAFLTVSLTGGSCEFRAVSNNPIPSDPPAEGETRERNTGLLIGVQSGGADSTTAAAAIQSETIATALSASVLSIPSDTTPPSTTRSTTDSSMPISRPEQVVELSALEPTVEANSSRISRPIPEPGGIWLFGLGAVFLSWHLRHPRLLINEGQKSGAGSD
jgi:hypothetical protein